MKKRDFKNILVVRTDRIGDVVLTTPVLEALRIAYPKARISMMVTPITKDIVEGNPFLNEVIVFDKKGKNKGFWNFWRFVRMLREKKYDLAINYHLKVRMNFMLFHAGIPHRIGFKNNKFGFLLTEQYPDPRNNGNRHEAEYCLDLLKYIGIETKEFRLHVSIKEESEKWVEETFQQHGILKTDKLLAIHPGASCISKRWPPERFAEVADRLAQKYQAKILLVGAGDNQLIAREVLFSTKQPVLDFTGKTSVSHLISILKRCSLLISNDSGPVHLAVGVQTPLISVFGRNQPGLSKTRWRPLGIFDIALHNQEVGCEVCLAHNCQLNFKCLKSITVEHVLQAAEETITKSQRMNNA
ncbi:MAG: lipopolysaccharide heptosyltransferase II [Candidatus Omnitrophica bacterium]|nr:lipopolysaccharide heptosyltransferase II [Candidatus Omnitrophota bacterium]